MFNTKNMNYLPRSIRLVTHAVVDARIIQIRASGKRGLRQAQPPGIIFAREPLRMRFISPSGVSGINDETISSKT
jgi:hypothetical protein